MAIEKKEKSGSTATAAEEAKSDSLWRKPITLDVEEDEDDPLANLYRGREVATRAADDEGGARSQNVKAETIEPTNKNSVIPEKPKRAKKAVEQTAKSVAETPALNKREEQQQDKTETGVKLTEAELKAILKIKSETYHFTDIREILRGKSLDIYATLRRLCGSGSVCKIKHLDLMKQLDISRPTLFKQGEWLTKLSLIEKRNVPGDHFGTSYTVRRLENALPVSDALVKQLESYIENFGANVD